MVINSLKVSFWHPQCCLTPVKNAYGSHDCVRYSFMGQRRYRIEEANWNIIWNPIRDFEAEGGTCTLTANVLILITALLIALK